MSRPQAEKCDVGSWEQAAVFLAANTLSTNLTYGSGQGRYSVATAPADAAGSTAVGYMATPATVCRVDASTGLITPLSNGTCRVTAALFPAGAGRDAATSSLDVTVSGSSVISTPDMTGWRRPPVVDATTGTTYLVSWASNSYSITRVAADGTVTSGWQELSSAEISSMAIDSAGTLYVASNSGGFIARITGTRTNTPIVDEDWATFPAGFKPNAIALTGATSGVVLYAALETSSVGGVNPPDTVATVTVTMATDEFGAPTETVEIDEDWVSLGVSGWPTDVVLDSRGYLWVSDYGYGVSGGTPDGFTDVFRIKISNKTVEVAALDWNISWGNVDLAIDSSGTVYGTSYSGSVWRLPGNRADDADWDEHIDWDWLGVQSNSVDMYLAVGSDDTLYVASSQGDVIGRVLFGALDYEYERNWRRLPVGSVPNGLTVVGSYLTVSLVAAVAVIDTGVDDEIDETPFVISDGVGQASFGPQRSTSFGMTLAAGATPIELNVTIPQGAVSAPTTLAVVSSSPLRLAAGKPRVTVTATSAAGAVTSFTEPLVITFNGVSGLKPGYSSNGTSWTGLDELANGFSLAAGDAGFQETTLGGGMSRYKIHTTHLTSFGLRDPQPELTLTAAAASARVGGTVTTEDAGGSDTIATTYESQTSGVCTINTSGVVTAVSAGTCRVNAKKVGNEDLQDAISNTVSLSITSAPGPDSGPNPQEPLVPQGSPTVSVTTTAGAATMICVAPAFNRVPTSIAYAWTIGGVTVGTLANLRVQQTASVRTATCTITAVVAGSQAVVSATGTVPALVTAVEPKPTNPPVVAPPSGSTVTAKFNGSKLVVKVGPVSRARAVRVWVQYRDAKGELMTRLMSSARISDKPLTITGRASLVPKGVTVRIITQYRNAAGKVIVRAQSGMFRR
jgi:hypothetical protein